MGNIFARIVIPLCFTYAVVFHFKPTSAQYHDEFGGVLEKKRKSIAGKALKRQTSTGRNSGLDVCKLKPAIISGARRSTLRLFESGSVAQG